MKKIIILIVMFLLTGCYNYNELNDLGIIFAIYVDYQEGDYIVELEVLDVNKDSKDASYTVKETGKTFTGSLNDVYRTLELKPYYTHLYALIVSDNIAKDKLQNMYDYLLRDSSIRNDFYIFLYKGDKDILDYKTNCQTSVGEYLNNLIEINDKHFGKYYTCNFREVIHSYLNNQTYVIGEVLYNDDLVLENNYIVENNKLKTELDSNSMLLKNILTEKIKTFQFNYKNGYEVYNYKISPEIDEKSIAFKLKCDIKLLNIIDENISKISSVEVLENELNDYLKKYLLEILNYSLTVDTDIYNLNYMFYIKFPKKVSKDLWKSLNYKITVESTINEKGLTFNSIGADKVENKTH